MQPIISLKIDKKGKHLFVGHSDGELAAVTWEPLLWDDGLSFTICYTELQKSFHLHAIV